MATEPFFRVGGSVRLFGWVFAGAALLAMVTQDRFVYGYGRSKLIRQLDEIRRSVGLDVAILPESLEFLETTAQQWERVEHALQARVWDQQSDLKGRINQAAHSAMEDLVVLECGAQNELDMSDEARDHSLAVKSADLRMLADAVDATSAAIMTYPREAFDSNGTSPDGVIDQIEDLEEVLGRLGAGKLPLVQQA